MSHRQRDQDCSFWLTSNTLARSDARASFPQPFPQAEVAERVGCQLGVDRRRRRSAQGRRSLFIARQSVLTGMGLSVAAMLVAAAGYLPPVAGALLQGSSTSP